MVRPIKVRNISIGKPFGKKFSQVRLTWYLKDDFLCLYTSDVGIGVESWRSEVTGSLPPWYVAKFITIHYNSTVTGQVQQSSLELTFV